MVTAAAAVALFAVDVAPERGSAFTTGADCSLLDKCLSRLLEDQLSVHCQISVLEDQLLPPVLTVHC